MNKLVSFVLIMFIVFSSGCSTRGVKSYSKTKHYKEDVTPHKITRYSAEKSFYRDTMADKYRTHPTMNPYAVFGVKYYPEDVNVGDTFSGNASWYGPDFHGKYTSNGETYNMYDMTAAHKTLPMNTIVKVTNERNGLSTVVRINDRGPFIATRIIDLSNTAAKEIDMIGAGTAPVSLEVLGFYDEGTKHSPKNSFNKQAKKTKSSGAYALQIASFTQIDGALSTQESHDNTDGYRTIIKDVEGENGRVFKVLLKGFKTEEEARNYKKNSEFKNAFIVRED